ncbi:hypothetical protein [Pseudomonas sp. R1-15]|uniref:hypothetical protein n=1 Tax=Pseudomonas sp. R1-15 TaxID=2817399 RepID=UPI003DA7DBB4
MSNSDNVDQERINVALVSALLEVWQASASILSLNVDMAAVLASKMDSEDERKALVSEVMRSRDSVNQALAKIKKAVRLINPEAIEEGEDADH